MFRRTLIFSLFFLVAQLCFAAHEDYMFKHLEAGGGLSDNQVTAIFKDSKGFMWFGTASGLNRFDGYEMKVYRGRMDDDGSLPDNYVDAISEDASGNLWVHTPSGYAVYDMSADSFDCNMVARLAELGIEGEPELVHIDSERNLWIYVAEGGLYFHSKEGGVAKVSGVESEILGGGAVTDIVECAGTVVLVFDNGKLFGIDKGSLDVLWSEDRLGRESGGRLEVYSLFVDDEDCLWIYSVLGLWKYRLPQREWLAHNLRKGGFDVVRTIAQDSEGAIWLGKDRGGIEIIEKSGQSHNLLSDMSDARALHDDTISTLFADETGTVWVGTYKTGVYLYNESIFKFAIDNVGDINCVEEDPDG
ncbi:MAG: hybrid sensor histidine kinase/response regulator, partial [Bacteroidales bacterium]|nr:hybrid sensor histidine kinase/response regulator [Bacteroidales bacterium]